MLRVKSMLTWHSSRLGGGGLLSALPLESVFIFLLFLFPARPQVARRLSAASSALVGAFVEGHGRKLSLMVRRSVAATSWLHHKVVGVQGGWGVGATSGLD